MSGLNKKNANLILVKLFNHLSKLEKHFIGKVYSIPNAIIKAKKIIDNKKLKKPVI